MESAFITIHGFHPISMLRHSRRLTALWRPNVLLKLLNKFHDNNVLMTLTDTAIVYCLILVRSTAYSDHEYYYYFYCHGFP